ncbi:MAG: hypothetical protein JM58_02750 [Peptococcaceae bacterium BICA1-8]|nr:MAG: hypothetical protein JM58_02750 [Peptococcaceae bacterium BICA1-8]
MNSITLLVAYIIDLIIGDPPDIPHPVIIIGKMISHLENILYKKEKSNVYKFISGAFLVLIVISFTFLFTWLVIYLCTKINPILGLIVNIWLISTTIAVKGLFQAGARIQALLKIQNISCARKEVGFIVGRDTDNLDETPLIRATVETVAENIVDAITSPLFFAFIGGAPLAMVYRAVNTLDSMLGYRNEKYLFFGKTAARIDDAFNYLPARLTGIFISLTAFLLPGYSGSNSFKILLRDARNHPSPNSGYSESAVSGALGVRLGGLNYYHGLPSQRQLIGDNINPLVLDTISKTNKLMLIVSALWVGVLTLLNRVLIQF